MEQENDLYKSCFYRLTLSAVLYCPPVLGANELGDGRQYGRRLLAVLVPAVSEEDLGDVGAQTQGLLPYGFSLRLSYQV